jgi:hypothetical protein
MSGLRSNAAAVIISCARSSARTALQSIIDDHQSNIDQLGLPFLPSSLDERPQPRETGMQ